jgi:alginate O-acetyltransferase complex protein AlgI
MLFNSYAFIFVFLPITLFGFFLIGTFGKNRVAVAWPLIASLFFYGWWNPPYLWLLIVSLLFNYTVGTQLSTDAIGHSMRKSLLVVDVCFLYVKAS